MISNPEMQAASASAPMGWPRLFSYWQLLSLVPGVVHRLANAGRVLELEVGGQSLLAGLARNYPTSQFIGLTTQGRSRKGSMMDESISRNLHFRTVERMDLSRFRQVDLVMALGGLPDRATVRDAAATMPPGGYLVLREEEKVSLPATRELSFGTRYLPMLDRAWSTPTPLRHSLTTRALSSSFATVHVIRLPEDPGYFYYVARAA